MSKIIAIPADWVDDPLACHELDALLRRVSQHKVTPGAATTAILLVTSPRKSRPRRRRPARDEEE